MGKLFKQNILYEFVQRAIYLGKSQFKTSSIFAATVFNAAISLFYSWKFCSSSGCLLNSPQKNTNSHFVNSASAIELCDFFHGNLILQYIDVIVQKRVWVFHRVSKRRNIWNHEAAGRVVLLFSSVWKPDETRSTSFWNYFSNYIWDVKCAWSSKNVHDVHDPIT